MSELGNTLREAREERQLSLDELQNTTKIQKRYLQAIEQGEFNKLPGDFYTRAFVKTYAETLGLNAAELMETYQNELPQRSETIERLPPRSERVQARYNDKSSKALNILPTLLIIIVLLAVAVIIWFMAQSHGGQSKDTGVKENAGSDVSMKNNPGAGTKVTPNTPTKPKSKSTSPSNKITKPKSTEKNKTKNQKSNQTKNQQKVKVDKTVGTTSYLTLSNTDTFVLDIKARDANSRSWVEVREQSSTGNKLFYGMLTKDNEVHLDLSKEKNVIFIKVGLTTGATIQINKKTVNYPINSTTQNLYVTFDKTKKS